MERRTMLPMRFPALTVHPYVAPLLHDCGLWVTTPYYLIIGVHVMTPSGVLEEVMLQSNGYSDLPTVLEVGAHLRRMKSTLERCFAASFAGGGELKPHHVHLSPDNASVWQSGKCFAKDGHYVPGTVCFGIIGDRRNFSEVAEQALSRFHYFYELARAISTSTSATT